MMPTSEDEILADLDAAIERGVTQLDAGQGRDAEQVRTTVKERLRAVQVPDEQ